MKFRDAIVTAMHSLAQNRIRAVLTTLGIVIGVLSVIVLVALAETAEAYVEQAFDGMGSNILIITPGKQETTGFMPIDTKGFHRLTHENARIIERRAAGVEAVTANIISTGILRYNGRQRNSNLIACTPGFTIVRETRVTMGRFINDEDIDRNAKVCVLGATIRRDLFGDGPVIDEKVSINNSKHRVIGITEARGMLLGVDADEVVYIPLPSGQEMCFGGEDELSRIVLSVRTAEDVPRAKESIHEILFDAHDRTEDFTITEQDDLIASVNSILDILCLMLLGVAGISLLVGGIGIMNIMLVSVRERIREVGVRKAVGARRIDIAVQFLTEAVVLSVLGGVIGIALGWLVAFVVRQVYPEYPVHLSPWAVVLSLAFSLAVGVFFGVYPAVKAASTPPLEALRYE